MALRAQILERNEALQRAGSAGGASPVTSAPATKPASFAATLEDALQSVNAQQRQAGALSESYERGETIDIAKVMLARQQASVGFEATLQVRNKLLRSEEQTSELQSLMRISYAVFCLNKKKKNNKRKKH